MNISRSWVIELTNVVETEPRWIHCGRVFCARDNESAPIKKNSWASVFFRDGANTETSVSRDALV